MNKIEYGLEGAFKVDLFSGNKFHSTTDWFSNFITPTGLMYPTGYAFADCFRFLSLGASSTAHQGSVSEGSFGTTGLVSPIGTYRTSEGTYQSGLYIGWEAYASGANLSNCGTAVTEAGPRFYRAWYIPSGANTEITVQQIGSDGLDIREFMVSPSSGSDEVGKYAFSRVLRNLFIPNGFRAIVSYQLKVSVRNTGATFFPPGSFNITNAEVSTDADIVNRWASLSGYFRQVYFGLRCVDNLGLTYIPRFGDGMEPASRNLSKMVWYLSPDNSQFDINGLGGPQTVVAKSYTSDGLMHHVGRNDLPLDLKGVVSQPNYETMTHEDFDNAYKNTNITVTSLPADDEISDELSALSNIRLGSYSTPLNLPNLENYKTALEDVEEFTYQVKQSDVSDKQISYATPGVGKFSDFYTDFGKLAAFAGNTTKLPLNVSLNNITTRKKTITRRSTFSPVSSLGYNTRFGSLVYAYEAAESSSEQGQKKYWPMVDCMFVDSSGKYMLPHYRYITGMHLTNRGTGVLDGSLFLSGNVGGSIYKFTSHKTFQGGASSILKHWITGARINEEIPIYSGFIASGAEVNQNVSGATGLTINGVGYPSGWGEVYGVIVDENFYNFANPDLGLSEHSLSGLTEASNTGKIYWPYTSLGHEIKLHGSGFKFWTPEFATDIFSDNAGWFGPDRQIVKDVNFDRLDTSYLPIVSTDYMKNVSGYTGFVLTTGRYNGTEVKMDAILNNAATSYGITGYLVPVSRNSAGQLKATSWVDNSAAIPTDTLQFIPTLSSLTLGGYAGNPVIKRVSKLFSSFADRGYPDGTGLTPIKAGDQAHIFFTGYSGNPTLKSGLYLTYITGDSSNKIIGYSYMSGTVGITQFSAPTGYPLHAEVIGGNGYRLGTNFAPANYYGSDIYTAISGGEYPALSLDNGLEMYLDISWSSPCGPSSTNCNEPS